VQEVSWAAKEYLATLDEAVFGAAFLLFVRSWMVISTATRSMKTSC
jgi:hypothetical protein